MKTGICCLNGAAFLLMLMSFCACMSRPAIDWDKSRVLSAGLGKLGYKEWKADLDFLLRTLEKRHPNPWHAVSRAAFRQALYAPAAAALPPDILARKRWIAVMKALALVREGHTQLLDWTLTADRLPVRIECFAGEFYVTAAAESSLELAGGKLIAVNDVPVSRVYAGLIPYLGAESSGWMALCFAYTVANLEILKDAGVVPEAATGAALTVAIGGEIRTREVTATRGYAENSVLTGIFELRGIEAAESIRRAKENYWYSYLPGEKAVLVQYNRCANDKDLPFARFCSELFALIDKERPERLVLDLRNNSGGNSALFTESMLPRLRSSYLNHASGIIVLTGPWVFSSGLFAVAELKRNTKALFIGEPTGEGYNHYGMTGTIMLPASGLVVTHSTRFWKLWPGDTRDQVDPDISAPRDAESWFAGRDLVLEQALAIR